MKVIRIRLIWIFFQPRSTDTLELLLRMVSGLPLLPVDNYDVIDKILYAAEKYDMPGPMSIIRLLIMTPPLLDQPFRLYTVACRYGWEEEASFLSSFFCLYSTLNSGPLCFYANSHPPPP